MEGHRIRRDAHGYGWRLAIAVVAVELAFSAGATAQVSGRFPAVLPNATIVTHDTNDAPDAESVPNEATPPAAGSLSAPHSHPRQYATAAEPSYSAAVEPTHAMLKVKKDVWAYAGPESSSPTVEHLHAGKFVSVTGSTHYYVQVKLKGGDTAYVPISAVELTRSQDKILRLSADAAVLSQPNRYGKKLSEVHQGHDVHGIGMSMNYVKIRMKSGLEGYVPTSATVQDP
jgi:hypothetical protein